MSSTTIAPRTEITRLRISSPVTPTIPKRSVGNKAADESAHYSQNYIHSQACTGLVYDLASDKPRDQPQISHAIMPIFIPLHIAEEIPPESFTVTAKSKFRLLTPAPKYPAGQYKNSLFLAASGRLLKLVLDPERPRS